jgi:hypothetical protein
MEDRFSLLYTLEGGRLDAVSKNGIVPACTVFTWKEQNNILVDSVLPQWVAQIPSSYPPTVPKILHCGYTWSVKFKFCDKIKMSTFGMYPTTSIPLAESFYKGCLSLEEGECSNTLNNCFLAGQHPNLQFFESQIGCTGWAAQQRSPLRFPSCNQNSVACP